MTASRKRSASAREEKLKATPLALELPPSAPSATRACPSESATEAPIDAARPPLMSTSNPSPLFVTTRLSLRITLKRAEIGMSRLMLLALPGLLQGL